MRLILIRHGQTACNVHEIWHGWDECDLTEIGRAQAEALGRRLACEHIDHIYSSDTLRARQTAEPIARAHGLPVSTLPALRERFPGEYEGRPTAEIVAGRPTIWQERDADLWGWRPPGGESMQDVLDRALSAIDELRARHSDETVVAVSHMGTTRVLISHLAGIPLPETMQLPFPSTGLSIFNLSTDPPSVERLNDGAHIEGL